MLHSIAKKGKLQGEISLFLGMIETAFLAYHCHSRSGDGPFSFLSSQGNCPLHKLKMAPHFPEESFSLDLNYWTQKSNWRNLICVASGRAAEGVRQSMSGSERERVYGSFKLDWSRARLEAAACREGCSLKWLLYTVLGIVSMTPALVCGLNAHWGFSMTPSLPCRTQFMFRPNLVPHLVPFLIPCCHLILKKQLYFLPLVCGRRRESIAQTHRRLELEGAFEIHVRPFWFSMIPGS